MNKQKHILMYSMGAVFSSIFIALIIYVAELPSWVNFTATVMLIVFTVLGLKSWRDKYNNGLISYGKAMGYTTLLVLYYSIVIAIWTYIFFKFIGPDQLEKMRDQEIANAIERLKKFKVPENQWETSLGLTRRMFQPAIQSIIALFGGMFMYTIFNLIICAILKKDPKAGANDQPSINPSVA